MTVNKKDLQSIMDYIHFRFNYTSDVEERGLPDHWVDQDELNRDLDKSQRADFKDDCDGFALACRYKCRQLSIPSRLVLCRTETGEYHLVLEVEGWILDNRSKWVVKRDYVDYTWISISGFSKGDDWRSIFGGTE